MKTLGAGSGLVLAGLALVLTACESGRSAGDAGPPLGAPPVTIQLSSPAFAEGAMIPRPFTCDGENVSPPLAWSEVPETTRSLAILCEDPDAPRGIWTHWVLFNLSAAVAELPARVPAKETVPVLGQIAEETARQGTNDFGKLGYGGPCPPSGTHRYVFRLFALDTTLDLKPGATRRQVLEAMKGHVVAEGRLIGRYARDDTTGR